MKETPRGMNVKITMKVRNDRRKELRTGLLVEGRWEDGRIELKPRVDATCLPGEANRVACPHRLTGVRTWLFIVYSVQVAMCLYPTLHVLRSLLHAMLRFRIYYIVEIGDLTLLTPLQSWRLSVGCMEFLRKIYFNGVGDLRQLG